MCLSYCHRYTRHVSTVHMRVHAHISFTWAHWPRAKYVYSLLQNMKMLRMHAQLRLLSFTFWRERPVCEVHAYMSTRFSKKVKGCMMRGRLRGAGERVLCVFGLSSVIVYVVPSCVCLWIRAWYAPCAWLFSAFLPLPQRSPVRQKDVYGSGKCCD